jgi:hypothetical protein
MRTALFWAVTQRVVVILCGLSGPIGCPERSVDGGRTYVWNTGGKILRKQDRSIWTETHPSAIPLQKIPYRLTWAQTWASELGLSLVFTVRSTELKSVNEQTVRISRHPCRSSNIFYCEA